MKIDLNKEPFSILINKDIEQYLISFNVFPSINNIGSYIGTHGNLSISCPSLCRVNSHLNAIENHTAHDDPKIGDCVCVGILL